MSTYDQMRIEPTYLYYFYPDTVPLCRRRQACEPTYQNGGKFCRTVLMDGLWS